MLKKYICVLLAMCLFVSTLSMVAVMAEESDTPVDVDLAEIAEVTDEDTDPRSKTELLKGFAIKDTYFATMAPQTITYKWNDKPVDFNTVGFFANYAVDQGPLCVSLDVSYDGETWERIVDNRYLKWNAAVTDPQPTFISFPKVTGVVQLKIKVETAGLTWGHYIMKVKITDISDEQIFKSNFDTLNYDTINKNQIKIVDEAGRSHYAQGSIAPINLPKSTEEGAKIEWSCYPDVVDLNTGELKIEPYDNLKVTLKAKMTYGDMSDTKTFYHWYRTPVNHALTAKVTASSERSDGPAVNAIKSMSYNGWVANERTPWIQLDWDKPVKVAQIVLSDIPNVEWENIEEGYILFSDGTRIAVDKLPEEGFAKDINLPEPKMITSLKFVVTKNGGAGAYGGLLNICVLDRIASDVPQPIIYPQPTKVTDVKEPKICLNGKWKFTMDVPDEFWKEEIDTNKWDDINVPGELEFQGQHTMLIGKDKNWGANPEFLPGEDVEYPYETTFDVPKDYANNRVLLNFRATFTYARIWIDGKYVGDHEGGFSTWDIDITDYVTPGKPARLTVGLTARKEFIEYRHARGILGDVFMQCVPAVTMDKFVYDPLFDDKLENATLNIASRINFNKGDKATAKLKLNAPDGSDVAISPNIIEYTKDNPLCNVSIPIAKPVKWDSEHPNLYKLTVELESDNKVLATYEKKVGFRDIRVKGPKIFVNGQETKFNGGNLLRATADNGDAVPIDDIKKMVLAMKNSNFNYIRTAHYPFPTEILDYCDEIGMYVESEVSNTFVAGGVNAPGSQWDPMFTKRYMYPLYEMLEKDSSHPSIVIWSIGNESFWGTHFHRSQEYIHNNDAQHRPVIFSWADNRSEILGRHYDAPYGNNKKPVIFQEIHWTLGFSEGVDPSAGTDYAWVIGRDTDEIRKSDCESGLVIWNFLDMKPEGKNANGGGVAGVYDSWLREKPEYYPLRKMQSPIKVADETQPLEEVNGIINIPVENRYNFTNLKDIKFEYEIGEEKGEFFGNDIKPFEKGNITLPKRNWKMGNTIHLTAYEKAPIGDDVAWRSVDEWDFTVGHYSLDFEKAPNVAPKVTETGDSIVVFNDDFKIHFSKETGLITDGSYKGEKVIAGGPYMNFGGNRAVHWKPKSINYSVQPDNVTLHVQGISSGLYDTTFDIKIDSLGRIKTDYTIYYIGTEPVDNERECGIVFDVVKDAETLDWIRRDDKISWYPESDILRNEGTANKTPEYIRNWGEKPKLAWKDDASYSAVLGISKNIGYDKSLALTNDFRSSKFGIHYAGLTLKDKDIGLNVEGDGTQAVRCNLHPENDNVRMFINNKWSFTGYTYQTVFYTPNGYSNSVTVRLGEKGGYTKTYKPEASDVGDGIVTHSKSAKVSASSVTGAHCVPFHGVDGNRQTLWISKGELTPWLLLEWDEKKPVDVLRFFGRDNNVDIIKDSYVEFDDGSRFNIGALPGDGSMVEFKLPETKYTKSAKFVVTQGAGYNIGMREFEVIGVPKTNIMPR